MQAAAVNQGSASGFVVQALSCCMGPGRLSLRGRQQRPWLTMQCCERRRSELEAWVKELRRAHDGPLEVVRDWLPTRGFYDELRVRLQGEGLYRVHELLCPRDEVTWSESMLELVGWRGYAAWFEEAGQWRQGRLSLRGPVQQGDYEDVRKHLQSLGMTASPRLVNGAVRGVELRDQSAVAFLEEVRPLWRAKRAT